MSVPAIAPAPSSAGDRGLSFARMLRSEWIKLRTIRSTFWCSLLIVVLTAGFGLLLAATLSRGDTGTLPVAQQKDLEVQAATLGLNFVQLVAAVLGVLVIAGEYGTGMIRSTFAAAPRRLEALAAKVIVLAVLLFVVTAIGVAAAAAIGAPILAGKGVDVHLADPDVWLPLLGAPAYVGLVGALSFGIGAAIRNSAAGIAIAIGLLFVLNIVLSILGGLARLTWADNVRAILPGNAGAKMYAFVAPGGEPTKFVGSDGAWQFTTLEGFLVFAGWVALSLVVAGILVERRDV